MEFPTLDSVESPDMAMIIPIEICIASNLYSFDLNFQFNLESSLLNVFVVLW